MLTRKREFKSERFSCTVCSNVFVTPATIPCGHTFCAKCIETHWDGEDGQPRYTCPLCTQSFSPRPVPMMNTNLVKVIKDLKESSDGNCYAGPDDIACDVCTGKKCKADKTCMGCRISYCKTHLWSHINTDPYRKHNLVEPGIDVKENICSVHHEYVTMYCSTDKQMVCPRCAARLHTGHTIISIEEEMDERYARMFSQQKSLKKKLKKFKKELDFNEELTEAVGLFAEEEVHDRTELFKETERLMQRSRAEVDQEIRAQQQKAEKQVQELQPKLEQEIAELKRQQAELETLSDLKDPGQLLLKYKHLSPLKDEPQSSSIQPLYRFQDITKALIDLPNKLQADNMSLALTQSNLLMRQPMTREEFLKYAVNITMDPNTAHKRLVLSEENQKITLGKQKQNYLDHSDRFNEELQVLSSEALPQRCYFEVQWLQQSSSLGFTYKTIRRKGRGKECKLGMNNVSWALEFSFMPFVWSSGKKIRMRNPPFFRIGVFLDHTAGAISFYGVNDEEMHPFGIVQTLFTQRLYVAANFKKDGDSAEFLKMK